MLTINTISIEGPRFQTSPTSKKSNFASIEGNGKKHRPHYRISINNRTSSLEQGTSAPRKAVQDRYPFGNRLNSRFERKLARGSEGINKMGKM